MPECKDLGRRNVSWQSVVTSQISLKRLNVYATWDSGGILAPHLESADTWKNRQKVMEYLNSNIGKKGLVPIKDIASKLRLTEEFVLIALEDFGMEITEECEG